VAGVMSGWSNEWLDNFFGTRFLKIGMTTMIKMIKKLLMGVVWKVELKG
jgi:hypothetical protein